MCTICAAFRPMDSDCFYRELNPEKFVPPTDTEVAYGVTQATGNGASTGGVQISAATNTSGSEGSDAANGQNTNYGLNVSTSPSTFNGTISFAGDRDWIEVELTAGDIYAFEATGRGSNSLDDTFLRLRDKDGNIIKINDDAGDGFDASIFYEAEYSGTFYIDVGAYINTASQAEWLTGDYSLTVTEFAPGNSLVSKDELADYLTDGFWATRGGQWNYFDSNTSVITVDIDGLTADGQRLAKWAMQSFEMFLDIEFDIVSSGADIVFDDEVTNSAYASPVFSGWNIDYIEVNVGKGWLNSYGTQVNDYSFQTYIHELGHALGLGHQGDYNGSASFEVNPSSASNTNTYLNDNWLNSIMSYFNQDENPFIGSSYGITVTPMLVDIIALQNLYGTPTASETPTAGNTVWGKGHTFDNAFAGSELNTGSGSYLAALFDFAETGQDPNDWFDGSHIAFTIYDVGGNDLIDFSFDTSNQIVSLMSETLSTVFNPYLEGRNDNMWIARNTIIEDYYAGSGDDSIQGNDVANEIMGNAGQDTIFGGNGNDELNGGSGNDALYGDAGSDTLIGGEGTDTAYFDQNIGAYTFELAGPHVRVINGATDFVYSDVEFLSFDGAVYTFAQISELAGPIVPVTIENNGDHSLVASGDTYLIDGSMEISLNGDNVSRWQFENLGWQAIELEERPGGGYQLLWENSDGRYAYWELDASGAHTNSFFVDPSFYENAFESDIDGDGSVGVAVTVVEANGDHSLTYSGDSYLIDGTIEISLNGASVSRASFASLNWQAVEVEERPGGGYQLLWENSDGRYAYWELDGSGAHTNSFFVDPMDYEIGFESDINGDGDVGRPATTIETNGDHSLVSSGDSLFIDGTTEISLNGTAVSLTSFANSGWQAIEVEERPGGGFRLMWENTNGSYAYWELNSAGAHTNSFLVNPVFFEPAFESDIDGDGNVGRPVTIVETNGDHALAYSGDSYLIDSTIEISLNGSAVSRSALASSGWQAIELEERPGGGYQLMWENSDGRYAYWELNAGGAHTNSFFVDPANYEADFESDIDGDGNVGQAIQLEEEERWTNPEVSELSNALSPALFAGLSQVTPGEPEAVHALEGSDEVDEFLFGFADSVEDNAVIDVRDDAIDLLGPDRLAELAIEDDADAATDLSAVVQTAIHIDDLTL